MSVEKSLPLPNLSIKGFRGFGDLSISRLGRVTLVAGENNTGKTSILEAVRLFAEGGTPEVIGEILRFREEDIEGRASNRETSASDAFLMSALFTGFPLLSEVSEPITISCCEGSREMRMHIGWFVERPDENGRVRLISEEVDVWDEYDSIPALVVEDESGWTGIYRIEALDRRASNPRPITRRRLNRVPSIFVSSSSTDRTEMLGPLWDNISLTPMEPYLVEALQIFDPHITAVSVIGERAPRNSRGAVVSADNLPRRVPLRSFGDGMNRLFGIVLSLLNVNDGILLIDEFENGMHFTVQVDAWRMIFQLARELNIQVISTTHSSDCIAGFMEAASESEGDDGLLIRLERYGARMRVVEYNEEDLYIAVRQQIEVR